MVIREITQSDVSKLREFVNTCKPLGLHTAFTYWVLSSYFSNICFVMEIDNNIKGWVAGIKSTNKNNTFYIWQIGVSQELREQDHSAKLIGKMVEATKKLGGKYLQFSVSPANQVSYNVFASYAGKNGFELKKVGEVKYVDQLTGDPEFENLYEYEIG